MHRVGFWGVGRQGKNIYWEVVTWMVWSRNTCRRYSVLARYSRKYPRHLVIIIVLISTPIFITSSILHFLDIFCFCSSISVVRRLAYTCQNHSKILFHIHHIVIKDWPKKLANMWSNGYSYRFLTEMYTGTTTLKIKWSLLGTYSMILHYIPISISWRNSCTSGSECMMANFICQLDWAIGTQVKHYAGCVCEGVLGWD